MTSPSVSHTPTVADAPPTGRPSPWVRKTARFAALGFVALVLYALSFGPALRLNQRGVIRVDTLERAYFPLMVVADSVPGLPNLLEAYSHKWLDPVPALP